MFLPLEDALKAIDQLPHESISILGVWELKDSPQIITDALSLIAAKTERFDTYAIFLKRFTSNPERPKEPNPDDPIFRPPPNKVYSADAIAKYGRHNLIKVETAYNFKSARSAYEEALQIHQTEATNTHFIRSNFDPNIRDYIRYCELEISRLAEEANDHKSAAILDAFVKKKRSLPIAEKVANLGTFIVGNHGSGKSEVIKHRVWHYLTKSNPHETIIVIDPHGELAPEIARMKPNLKSDRLVYFDPFLMSGFMPCMSFMNTSNKTANNIYRESEAYGSALQMVSGDFTSDNMKLICQRSAHVTLESDNFNILDFQRLIEVEPPKKGQPDYPEPSIYRFACSKSQNQIIRDFFKNKFLYGNYSQAKNALSGKISNIIMSPIMQQIFLNASSVDFGGLIDQRKVIVVNIPEAELGEDVTRMIGQLIVAQITLAIRSRDIEKISRYPQVHLFMDEAHYFVSRETAKQIDELRKRKLSLTLATQYIDKFPKAILESVKGLGVQIAGFCAGNNLAEMNDVFDLKKGATRNNDIDERTILNQLPVGNFYFKVRATKENPPIKARRFKIDTSLLFNDEKWRKRNANQYMTDKEWEQCKHDQIARYYRKIEENAPFEAVEEQEHLPSRKPQDLSPEFNTIIRPQKGYD